MNKIKLNWKYGLIVLMLAAVCACSENDDLAQIANKQNYQDGTRTANWYTKEVTLEDIGQLETKLTEAMNGEPLDTLEKLVISGPMAATDFNYLRNNLSGIKSLDLKDASINESDAYYWNPYYGSTFLKNDTICHRMFYHWGGLEEIVLPSSVLYIDEYAFSSCQDLVSVVMPENVKRLNSCTFEYCRSLSSVTFPANLEGIGYHVFYDCDSLKSITIPDKVKYIGDGAFYNCNSLSSVEFSDASELDSIDVWVFYNTKLKSITIPDKVKYIGDNTFKQCKSLSSVVLPSNLKAIEFEVFSNCDSLQSIAIPDKVKYIGHKAFSGCDLLSSVEFSSASELDSISSYAFYQTKLKSITIPNSVRYIGDYAFQYCRSMASLVLPSNLEAIESFTFGDCDSLQNIVIPDKVKYIGQSAFGHIDLLSSIEFSSSSELDSIASWAIDNTNLKSVVIPDSVSYIGDYAFYNCNSLASITIPNGVEHIGTYTFYSCDSLTELMIPESVTSIGESFASDCSNLQAIIWNAPIDVPYCWGSNDCLFFVETNQEISVNDCWNNVIRNGVAEFPVTIQARGNQFNIPREFIAPEVTYTRSFWDETVPGGSSGWQTIVLPFTPDSILHDTKGVIAPFGSDVVDAKPFWLRELTSDGFTDVTTISPDKAYIIAMPNHSDYLDEYRLNGTITFKATNVTLAKTPEVLEPSYGPDFDFYPTYNYVKKALRIYALQSKGGQYGNKWYYKNFFTRSASDINPFNAYVTAKGGGRSSRAEFDLDTRSKATRGVPYKPNTSGIPQIGDM